MIPTKRSMFPSLLALSSLMAAGLVISSADAAITLDAFTDGSATSASSATTRTLSGFDPLASDKLVVVAGAAVSTSSFGVGITSITYNGVAMVLATRIDTTAGAHRATGIYYLDKAFFPGTVGNIVVTFDQSLHSDGYDIGAFALSGTATGVDAASSNRGTGNTGTSATINVIEAGSFVAAVNSYGFLDPSVGMTELGGTDPLTRAYQNNVAAGSFTASFGGGQVTSVASFAPIPEPSAALLGGLGMLALLRRRRN